MQYSQSCMARPYFCAGNYCLQYSPLIMQVVMPLCKIRVWPCKTTVQLTSYGTTRGQWFVVTDHGYPQKLGICSHKFNPTAIVSVDQMNLLVVCWLKHCVTEVAKQFYECCTGQLASCYPVYRIYTVNFKMTICCSVLNHNQLVQLYADIQDEKFLNKKTQANLLQFIKIFSLQNFVLYNIQWFFIIININQQRPKGLSR